MSEKQENFDSGDYPFGCLFALLIVFAIVIIICVFNYKSGDFNKGTLYALTGSVIFFLAVLIQTIIKVIKAIQKKSRGE